ncbi:MAG: hypothetical protein FJY92_00460 [Candidatus Hydrogenedentes bacterium]|nr:hypothetical protein [Candidatus Hydrogenedentota bacterium]
MNTDCSTYRETLRTRCDAGAGMADGAPDHADECAACAAYRDELIAFSDAFAAVPLEVPRNALVQRVKARLADEPAYANDVRAWLSAAGALACALLVGAALYFGAPVDPWTWWDYAIETGATPEWMLRGTTFDAEVAIAQGYWNEFSALLAPYSSTAMWSAAAAAALVLVALNGAEAYRLRARWNGARMPR